MRFSFRRVFQQNSVSWAYLFSLVAMFLVVFGLVYELQRVRAIAFELQRLNEQCQSSAAKLAENRAEQQTLLKRAHALIDAQEEKLGQSERFRTNTAHYFTILAGATIQLGSDEDGHCRGGFVQYRGRVVMLTAAHCVDERQELIPHRWYQVQPNGSSTPSETLYHFRTTDLKEDSCVDLARVRLPDWARAHAARRALEIASETPGIGDLVLGLHWSHDWSRQKGSGRSLAIVAGTADGIFRSAPHMYRVAGGAFGGVSGSLRIDVNGKVVGVTSKGTGNVTLPVGPRTIRAFLDRYP